MPEIQIGQFSVTVTHAPVSQGTVNRTSGASVVAGPANVTLELTLKDEYGNLVSGLAFHVIVKGGEWFDGLVDFVNGMSVPTPLPLTVTAPGVFVNVPVAVVI